MTDDMIPDTGRISGNAGRRITQIGGPAITEPRSKSRITVTETTTYNVRGAQPVVVQTKFGRGQETEEQAYQRRIKVDEQWVKFEYDRSWITTVGMCIISNEEGKYQQRIPTREQIADIQARVVEIYLEPLATGLPIASKDLTQFDPPEPQMIMLAPFAALLLPPGEQQRYTLGPNVALWLRCQHADAKLIVTFLPG
jgi:hypothetical protein